MRYKLLTSAILLLAAGCTETPESKVKRGVDYAARRFKQINSNLMTRLAFQDLASQGGSLKTFIIAAIADDEIKDLPEFCNEDPCGPYTVALSQDQKSGEFIVEGFAENQEEPVVEKRVTVNFDEN